MAQGSQLTNALNTSLALIDQFLTSLDITEATITESSGTTSNHPSPSHLLTASATSLKSSVTKISLLTITAPFTPSAILSILQPLNSSILPSLVTASILTSPVVYPEVFARESNTLTRVVLRSLKSLLALAKARADNVKNRSEISDAQKKGVTEATGIVWEDCDRLIQFSKEDAVTLICRKASQWLDLMRDAVKEFQEWDPEDEVDDDPFGLNDAESDDEIEGAADKSKDDTRAMMSAGVKDQAIKVLNRIPQSIHVVIKQRLQKIPKENLPGGGDVNVLPSASTKKTVDLVWRKIRKISDCIDESAEAMYLGDPELCLKKAGEARALTIDVVEAVLDPWEKTKAETKEDQYIKRALAWIQQVEPGTVKS